MYHLKGNRLYFSFFIIIILYSSPAWGSYLFKIT